MNKNIFMIALISMFIFQLAVSASCEKIFYNSAEYNKIINNKEHITKVLKESYPEGGFEENICDIDKSYKMVESLKSVKKSNVSVADADSCYIFKFDDGSSVVIHFEGKFLHYKGQNYEIIKK